MTDKKRNLSMNSEKLSPETTGTFFFDNFTSFRFHFSPNLLVSVLFTKLSILDDKLLQINEKLRQIDVICIHKMCSRLESRQCRTLIFRENTEGSVTKFF